MCRLLVDNDEHDQVSAVNELTVLRRGRNSIPSFTGSLQKESTSRCSQWDLPEPGGCEAEDWMSLTRSFKEPVQGVALALFPSPTEEQVPVICGVILSGTGWDRQYVTHFFSPICCDFYTGFIATSPASQLSPTELIEMRNDVFNKEKNRQLSLTPRTEKIEVKHVGKTDPGTVFVMNKNVSTPYSCAMHLSEWYCRKSILALVDGQPWDMYKPLTKSCEIQFLTFKDRDPGEVNKAYWRSCAMMMGCVIERAFKDEYVVSLVRAPEVPVIAGAFCYDVVLDKRLDEWVPTKENLRSFTKDARALIYKDLPFEPLEVDAKVALEIFQHNKYKIDFIEEKASQNPERIVKLHRFGDFVDVSEGPLIPRTSICFQYEVSAVHNLQATQSSLVRRFQGLSLPVHLRAHFTIWDKLLERSRKMVTEDQTKPTEESTSP
nr:PREDICTED: 39S ribosomal protein L39, mitochondrial [Equus przewalskii]